MVEIHHMSKTVELHPNFDCVLSKALEKLFIDRMEQNEEITAKYMNEKEFQDAVGKHLMQKVYDQIRAQG